MPTPLHRRWAYCGGVFDRDNSHARLDELNAAAEDPNLWNNPQAAQTLLRERTRLEQATQAVQRLERGLVDNAELADMAEAENDADMLAEVKTAFTALAAEAQDQATSILLSGEADANDTYLEVHAGAGGTESQDWASMLLRMYTRWGDKQGYKVELMAETAGEEAGIKSATLSLKGLNAYGRLKTEAGTHRLVRISPFDSNARRHTSFVGVTVYPIVDDRIDIEILDKDLRVDVYRASGAGGQHVNRTESAVRITHLPTGIVVQCQTDRSQHKNKATCMTMLKARMYAAELRKREEAAREIEDAKSDIGWGHQIRSYVLQPYRMVKDLRTGLSTSATDDVLDGDISDFIAAALAQRAEGGTRVQVDDDEF